MMNIKIVSPLPKEPITESFTFGSRLYRTHDKNSDIDVITVTSLNIGDIALQYTETTILPNIDCVYINYKTILKRAYKGADQSCFEIIHNPEFKINSVLAYYNSQTIKMYLGYAKRDLKWFDERYNHIIRCIYCAEKIMNKEVIDFTTEIKALYEKQEPRKTKEELKEKIKTLRSQINWNKKL